MKLFSLLGILFFSLGINASTTDFQEFLYRGGDFSQVVNLTTEKTHTEYRQIEVPSTCYRTEYRYQCQTIPGQCRTVCDSQRRCRRTCTPPRRICRNIPVSVPYPCTRYENRPYEVFDYNVYGTYEFVINSDTQASELFSVKQSGENFSLSVKDSKDFIIHALNRSEKSSIENGVKYIDNAYEINLIDIKPLKVATQKGFYNVRLAGGVLSFNTLQSFDFKSFINNIKIYQYRTIGSDTLLLDRVLSDHNMSFEKISASENLVKIDLHSFGINLPSKIRVILNSHYEGANLDVLNPEILSSLNTSINYIFK